MEVRGISRKSSKAQLMTILVLVLFMLMLAELFAFALLNVSFNNAAQQLTVSMATSNYGSLLKQGAGTFAQASLSRALATLVNYEYTPSMRKGNLIANFSRYISGLMTNGILPNDASGYPQNAMANLTLADYNKSVSALVGFASQNVIINETKPVVFQTDPFHLRVSYIESIAINASGSFYRYSIPVNASVNLNNTPDMFFAQQGVLRPMKFAGFGNLTSYAQGSYASVLGAYASSGNTIGYAYGTTYNVLSSASSSAMCSGSYISGMPTQFNSALAQSLIIATYNALNLGSCIASYGGLISYVAPSSAPAMPYLIYPASSNVLSTILTGMHVLLYGPGMDALNIEGLRNAVMNGYYLASPFVPSYIDRANANLADQSPNGVLIFSNYNTQSANFNGASSYISTGNSAGLYPTGSVTIEAWFKYTSSTGFIFSNWWGGGWAGINLGTYTSQNLRLTVSSSDYADAGSAYNDGNWHQVVGVYDQANLRLKIFVDGSVKQDKSTSLSSISYASNQCSIVALGSECKLDAYYLSGSISNVQFYSSALSPSQVQQLYQEGISGLPISGNSLVGWWPLNGNANDYSGYGNNGIPTTVTYGLLLNYSRDSLLNVPVPTSLSPLPGVLSCTSNSKCAGSSVSKLYLGYMPLEVQSGTMQTGYFNGQNSYINCGSRTVSIPFSFGAWVKPNAWGAAVGLVEVSDGSYKRVGLDSEGVSNKLCVWYQGSANNYVSYCTQNPPIGAWTYVAGAINGIGSGNGVVYYNGVPQSMTFTSAGTPAASVSATCILGAVDTAPNYPFNGLIADAQIYGAALSAARVSTLYQEGVAGLPISGNSLAGWWPLNGDANDYSGNGYNGVAYSVIYPYFSGAYTAPGLSAITSTANEWQALGLANT